MTWSGCKKFLATDQNQWAMVPLRIALGIIFIGHGGQKLFGWWGGHGLAGTAAFFAAKFGLTPGWLWATLAGGGEFVGGLLLALGLFTRLGAFCICMVMLVAIFRVHLGSFFMPAGVEYPLSLLAAAVALLIAGGGKFSLDARLQA
jgi:putative oxidoreductase